LPGQNASLLDASTSPDDVTGAGLAELRDSGRTPGSADRLSMVRAADLILVRDNGRGVERAGSPVKVSSSVTEPSPELATNRSSPYKAMASGPSNSHP
jgi:hypothetical protein